MTNFCYQVDKFCISNETLYCVYNNFMVQEKKRERKRERVKEKERERKGDRGFVVKDFL